jgi:hypothetical protein
MPSVRKALCIGVAVIAFFVLLSSCAAGNFKESDFTSPSALLDAIDRSEPLDHLRQLDKSFIPALRGQLGKLGYSKERIELVAGYIEVEEGKGPLCNSCYEQEVFNEGKKLGSVANVFIGIGSLHFFYVQDESGPRLTGIAKISSKSDEAPVIETIGDDFWLIMRSSIDTGTGVGTGTYAWIDRFGEQKLAYPAQGYRDLFHAGAVGSMKVEPSASKTEADGKACVLVSLSLDFTYNDEFIHHADEAIGYRYEASSGSFEWVPEWSTLEPKLEWAEHRRISEDRSVWEKYSYQVPEGKEYVSKAEMLEFLESFEK